MYLAAVRMLLLTPLCIVRTPIIDVKCHSSGCFVFDHQIHTISNCTWDNSFGDFTCIQRVCYNCIVVHWHSFLRQTQAITHFFTACNLKCVSYPLLFIQGVVSWRDVENICCNGFKDVIWASIAFPMLCISQYIWVWFGLLIIIIIIIIIIILLSFVCYQVVA